MGTPCDYPMDRRIEKKGDLHKPGPSAWHCLATDDQVVKSIRKKFSLLRNNKSINNNNEMEFHFRINIIKIDSSAILIIELIAY